MKPNRRQLQFILAGVGSGAAGKNKKIKATPRNKRAMPLTRNPNLPRLNREGSMGSPLIRLANTQEMTMMYEEMSPI